MKLRFFVPAEFERCSPRCNIDDMHPETLSRLDMARELAGVPFRLTSAYRTIRHEKSRGRDGTSAHTLGRAVDIKCSNSPERWAMLNGLIRAGFPRIGIYRTWIHADDSPAHPSPASWLG